MRHFRLLAFLLKMKRYPVRESESVIELQRAGQKRPTPCVRLGLHKVAAAEEMALFSFFWAAVLIFSCTSFTEIDYAT